MRVNHYDVVVEGARVAGSRIARLLAEGGYKVALCDPSFGNPPSYFKTKEKPCGGVINYELINTFKIPEKFYSETAKKEIRIIDTIIERLVFISPDDKTSLEYEAKTKDVVVKRKNFDWYNLEPLLFMDRQIKFFPNRVVNAKKEGENFVTFLDSGEKLISSYEVGAGGVWSKVRNDLFWPLETDRISKTMLQFLYFKSEEEVKRIFENTAYFYFLKDLSIGYAFVFPGSNYVRVGVGQRNVKGLKKEFLQHCYNKIFENQILKDKLKGYRNKSEFLYHAVPFGGSKRFYEQHSTCTENSVLLGDAAIKTHNMTFEGNLFAWMDAEVAWECFSSDQSFVNFDREWKSRYGDKLIIEKEVITNFYDKEKLAKLIEYCKEFKEPEKFILAFKGQAYISRPDIVSIVRKLSKE
jgi:flavin-dependent dehydrogenase